MNDDICPNCNSKNTSGDSTSYGDHEISMEWYCDDCHTFWYANYKFTHNYGIETEEDFEVTRNTEPISQGKLLTMKDVLSNYVNKESK